jgi:membrane protein YqaA with SNARE-associated domain
MNDPQTTVPPRWQIHRRLYNWVLHWADTKYGLLALIAIAVTEPVCVPIPADVMVIGMSLGRPRKALWYGLICSMFSILGGTIAFALGLAIGGDNVVAFFEHIHLGDKVNLARELYQKYDFWAIAVSALTPVPYMLFSWMGGMAGVSIKKFILVSLVFRTMRFGSEGLLFRLFGRRARIFIDKYFNLATVIIIVLLAIAVYAMKTLGHHFAG